jgi:hypothetical protein
VASAGGKLISDKAKSMGLIERGKRREACVSTSAEQTPKVACCLNLSKRPVFKDESCAGPSIELDHAIHFEGNNNQSESKRIEEEEEGVGCFDGRQYTYSHTFRGMLAE